MNQLFTINVTNFDGNDKYKNMLNENHKKVEKKIIKKSEIGKAIASTFVHINHIGVNNNSFDVGQKLNNYLTNIYKSTTFIKKFLIIRSSLKKV